MTVLFTVGEEIGLWGARFVDRKDLGDPVMGFNIDGANPARLVIGAIGADRWEAHVHGKSAHAGLHPDGGISAVVIAAKAIAEVAKRGYHGKVRKHRKDGTSNVGIVRGGEATNQVNDYVFVRGESRSHDPEFLEEITQVYRSAFDNAVQAVANDRGERGSVEFRAESDYRAFRMDESSAPVALAMRCARKLRLRPTTVVGNGGLDANYLNERGIPTVTLGAGQHRVHTVDEYVEVPEFVRGCRLLVEIATAP
jgi:tripeptide aminopeptidase